MIRNRLTILAPMLLAAMPCGLHAQRPLAAVPSVRGELALRVQYPTAGSVLDVGDSTFLFGTVGDGRAVLHVNGTMVPVHPNGAWLAWVAVPRDSAPAFRLTARLGSREVEQVLTVRRAGWVREEGAWVAHATMQPVGAQWLPEGEAVSLRVRAVAGATLRLRLADGQVVPFVASAAGAQAPAAVLAFGRDSTHPDTTSGVWYVADLSLPTAPPTADWLSATPEPAAALPLLEVMLGDDTTRVPWPIRLFRTTDPKVLVGLDDRLSGNDASDGLVNGRPRPGGTYHWYFPNGTVATAEARVGEMVRLRLDARSVAWVPRAELVPLPGLSGVAAVMGSLTASATPQGVRLRIPVDRPIPHQIRTSGATLTVTLFGVIGDADWGRMPVADGFLEQMDWQQVAHDRVEIALRFAVEPWGWRMTVSNGSLLLEVRRPPEVDPAAPLAGRQLVVDAGHPPGGACGPTGRCEPELTLAVARLVAERLRQEGATVVMTRETMTPVALAARVATADSGNADALVSIHLNALPDGLNPFTNSGTSTFFQHPRGMALARDVQAALVAAFGLRDLGVAKGDLALVRPTWYPAVLAEALFLMLPEQEAAIASVEGQARYADAVVAGLRAFFADQALSTRTPDARLP